MTGDSVKIWGSLGTFPCKSKSFKNSAKKSAIFKKWNSFPICLKTVFYIRFKYLMKYWERKIYFSQCHVNGNVDNGLSLTHLVSQFILGRLSAIQPIAIKLWRQPKLYYNLTQLTQIVNQRSHLVWGYPDISILTLLQVIIHFWRCQLKK